MQRGKLYQFENRQKVEQLESADVIWEPPALPILPETLLYFELSVGQQIVTLDEMTDVVLRDPGATIQILRAAALEVGFCDDRECRIEDCVAALGVSGCIDALKDETSVRGGLKPEIRKVWSHAQKIAENCVYLAEEHGIGLPLRDAYLVGLYHELDTLPSLLGWNAKSANLSTALLVHAWSLPECVRAFFMEQQGETQWTPLSELVRLAHVLQAPMEITASAHM